MGDDGDLADLDDAQLGALLRRIHVGREPDTPPSHTIPKLTGESVQTFLARYLFQVVLLVFAHPGPGLWHAHEEIGAILEKNSFKLVGRLVIVEEHPEASQRYQIAQCPTYIAFRQGHEFKRFRYTEFEELKTFLNEQIAARTGRSIGDGPPPIPATEQPPPSTQKAPPPQPKSPPSTQKAARSPAKPAPSAQKAPPPQPKPAGIKAPAPEVPWVEFRRKPKAGFRLTPEQETTKQLMLKDEMNEADLDLAFQATGSADVVDIIEWIAQFQKDGELWAETDWIMAGRPAPPKPPPPAPAPATVPSPVPKPAAHPPPRPKPVAEPPQRTGPRAITIRFLIGSKTAQYKFEATATIADLVAKLREGDVPPEAKLSFAEPPAGRPLGPDDYHNTLEELKIVGPVRLVVTVLDA
jgi:outer membrane biosynthesis protein TonB